MRYGILTWVFGCFIYFKAAFEFAAIQELTVLTALLLALAFGWLVALGDARYGGIINSNSTISEVQGSLAPRFAKTFPWMIFHFIVYTVVARIIIFAFSPDLSREIGVFGNFAQYFDQDLAIFISIAFIPVAMHWLVFILRHERPEPASEPESVGEKAP